MRKGGTEGRRDRRTEGRREGGSEGQRDGGSEQASQETRKLGQVRRKLRAA